MDIQALATQVSLYLADSGAKSTSARPLPNLFVLQEVQTSEFMPAVYQPIICLILQGRKQTVIGEQTIKLGPGESLLVSHDLPVVARVTKASPQEPYIALVLTLDLAMLRSLYEEVSEAMPESPTPHANSAVKERCGPKLVDCLSRYLSLARDPLEAKVMAPLLLREIHFRLLMAPRGAMLRELLRHDSHASNISRAIARIRRDFRAPIAVPQLAREIGMSSSSFHKHFKQITSVTPLQYQKDLRLLEAKRLLQVEGQAVSDVAYEVGYESPNQFSREFSRKFGTSPRSQLKQENVGASN